METLHEVRKNFESMGLSPKLQPFNHTVLRVFLLCFLATILQWIFLAHVADSAKVYMESMYIVTATTGILFSFTNTILTTEKLFSYFKNQCEFVNERRLENPTSKEIVEKTNELVEKWSEIGIFVIHHVVRPCFVIPKAIICYFNYYTTDLGNEAFDLPFQMWLPYDWKNPIGYLVAVSFHLYLSIFPFKHLESFIFLAFGSFMFSISFVKILENELHSIRKMTNDDKSRKHIYEKLSGIMRAHADVKQVATSFSDVYDVTLTIVFLAAIITICVPMLLVQIEITHNEFDSIIIYETAVFGACALLMLLFICELGQRFSNAFGQINDVIIWLDWYLYPQEVQRILPTVMQSAQLPVVIKCFGHVFCSRRQFRKVVKTVYSYFMMLRKFYD